MATAMAVATMVILGSFGTYQFLRRSLYNHAQRARLVPKSDHSQAGAAPSGADEPLYDDRTHMPRWLGYKSSAGAAKRD